MMFALIRFLSLEEGNSRKKWPIPSLGPDGTPYMAPAWIKGADENGRSLAVWM